MCLNPGFAKATQSNEAAKSAAAMSDASKAMQLIMPVKDNGFKLGDVIVWAGTDGSILIQKDSLLTAIRNVLRAEALRDFEAKLPVEANIGLNNIIGAGIKCSYNPTDLEIQIEPTVEQRPRGEVTGNVRGNNSPDNVALPAALSGFVNARFSAAYERQEDAAGAFEFPAILFDGAVRWAGIVLEGEAQVGLDGTVIRRDTRLVYDLPQEAIRISAGDIALRPNGSFAVPPLLGVAIQKTYADLQPSRNIRPTGKRSFRIERASDVRVMVNGREIRRLQLAPGEYGLSDLPLSTGDNRVQLRIRDEFGGEEVVDYSILFNRTLLQPGISEWSLAAGIAAETGPQDPIYDAGTPIVSAAYRRGLSDDLTGTLNLQASNDAALFSGDALQQTRIGLVTLDASASTAPDGAAGWAAGTELELDPEWFGEVFGSAQIGAEIMSGSYIGALDQIPTGASRIRLSGSIAGPLVDGITASVSGYYLLSSENREDGFGTSIALNRVVGSDLSIGISGNYEERGGNTGSSLNIDSLNGLSFLARLNYRPSLDSDLTLQYDSGTRVTTGNIGSNFDSAGTHTGVELEIQHKPAAPGGAPEHLANADINYSDSRVEANFSQSEHVERLGTNVLSRRTAVNLGTAVAFADGQAAFGRPVRGSFAIVGVHKSLAESDVRLDPFQDKYKAASDGLGPLLVSDISAYAPSNLSYDVENLPVGYDLGSGAFDLLAPYKAGFNLSIGSEFAVTAIGTLSDGEGKPVPLKVGTISTPQFQDKKIVVFTNGTGKFTAQGLKAGEWTLETNDDPVRRYVIKIPEDAVGFFDLGELRPQA
jgi:outer membrane usher protein